MRRPSDMRGFATTRSTAGPAHQASAGGRPPGDAVGAAGTTGPRLAARLSALAAAALLAATLTACAGSSTTTSAAAGTPAATGSADPDAPAGTPGSATAGSATAAPGQIVTPSGHPPVPASSPGLPPNPGPTPLPRPGPSTTPAPPRPQPGWLTGLVLAAPGCPGPVPVGGDCPPRPVPAAEVTITGAGTQRSMVTDIGGRFRAQLAPGTYTVKVVNLSGLRSTTSQVVTLGPGGAALTLTVDSGIR